MKWKIKTWKHKFDKWLLKHDTAISMFLFIIGVLVVFRVIYLMKGIIK